jgi:hypothetical protein
LLQFARCEFRQFCTQDPGYVFFKHFYLFVSVSLVGLHLFYYLLKLLDSQLSVYFWFVLYFLGVFTKSKGSNCFWEVHLMGRAGNYKCGFGVTTERVFQNPC